MSSKTKYRATALLKMLFRLLTTFAQFIAAVECDDENTNNDKENES